MNPFVLLFDFRGRVGRATFWLAAVINLIAITLAVYAAWIAEGSLVISGLAVIVCLAVLISATAVGVKRIHDRNKKGWWLFLFYGAPLIALTMDWMAFVHGDSIPEAVFQYFGFAALIWMLIELGCLRGTIGANEYGGDPLAPQPAPPRTMMR
jgi:uncharacterized membrane protein YhaH (DUF805 family)